MSTTTNIEQYTENTDKNTVPVYVPPRDFNLSAFIDKCQWSRGTVYHAINGTGGSRVSEGTRQKIVEQLRHEAEGVRKPAPAS